MCLVTVVCRQKQMVPIAASLSNASRRPEGPLWVGSRQSHKGGKRTCQPLSSFDVISAGLSQWTAVDYRAGDTEQRRVGRLHNLGCGIGSADLESQDWLVSSLADTYLATTLDRTRDLDRPPLAFRLWSSNRLPCRAFGDWIARFHHWNERLRHMESQGCAATGCRSHDIEHLGLFYWGSRWRNGDYRSVAIDHRYPAAMSA